MSLGAPELIIVLVIVLLLFGAKRLPDLAGSLGKSIREFRSAADEETESQARASDDEASPRDTASS